MLPLFWFCLSAPQGQRHLVGEEILSDKRMQHDSLKEAVLTFHFYFYFFINQIYSINNYKMNYVFYVAYKLRDQKLLQVLQKYMPLDPLMCVTIPQEVSDQIVELQIPTTRNRFSSKKQRVNIIDFIFVFHKMDF